MGGTGGDHTDVRFMTRNTVCAHRASIYIDLSFFDHPHFFLLLLLFLAAWANLPVISLFPIYRLHRFMPGERGVVPGVYFLVLFCFADLRPGLAWAISDVWKVGSFFDQTVQYLSIFLPFLSAD